MELKEAIKNRDDFRKFLSGLNLDGMTNIGRIPKGEINIVWLIYAEFFTA